MSLYEEKPKAKEVEEIEDSPYTKLSDIATNLVDFDDLVLGYHNRDV